MSQLRSFSCSPIIKEGWVEKRAEHCRTWRKRYFRLHKDGSLIGYKEQPQATVTDYKLENDFHVKNSQIMSMDNEPGNVFALRAIRGNVTFERKFRTDTPEERHSWITAIKNLTMSLEENAADELANIADAVGGVTLAKRKKERNRKISLNDFEYLKVIGKGNLGKVFLCREKATSELFAMKLVKKLDIIKKHEVEHTLTENRVLRSIKHPFLISMKYAFKTAHHLCFVLEYVHGGELYYHLRSTRRFSESRARFYAAEIICALGYLHSKGVMYRDIKLENLMLDRDGHIKVADFGLCKDGISTENTTTATFCGTPEYLAPEIVKSDFPYTRAVDWWSLGVLLYEMTVGRLPFSASTREELYEHISFKEIEYPTIMSPALKDLLSGLLTREPLLRLGAGPDGVEEIKEHEFFYTINWQDLEAKKLTPPYIPKLDNDTDVRYFCEETTSEKVELTPPVSTELHVNENLFKQFSFSNSTLKLDSEAQS